MSPTPREAERFLVELRALPDSVPAVIRLRKFLKAALRAYNLRCERASQLHQRGRPAEDVALTPITIEHYDHEQEAL
jgi:hypothetical protein